MSAHAPNLVIERVRRALGEPGKRSLTSRPAVPPARQAGEQDLEVDLLLKEINQLSGQACRISASSLELALSTFVMSQGVKKAVLWTTQGLAGLRFRERLEALGVEVLPGQASKHEIASCDLGVTEVDFALPETGTLGLLSSPEKPALVSLLPRVHLAILRPQALRSDLHRVFSEAKQEDYLVFITGPSRTADIELTVALGVHGPKSLYVWCLT
jgi:L-lactate dehydrogenase complex protein LldG